VPTCEGFFCCKWLRRRVMNERFAGTGLSRGWFVYFVNM